MFRFSRSMELQSKVQFKLGLEYSFIDKNKYIEKNLATNFESLADKVTENLENCKRDDFHELLRAYVDIFTKKFMQLAIIPIRT